MGLVIPIFTKEDEDIDEKYHLNQILPYHVYSTLYPIGYLHPKRWLIRKIAKEAGLEVIDRTAVSTGPHFGRRMRLLSLLLWPIYALLGKEKNNLELLRR